ncbi:MAG: lytic transglycosylase domain-containing protein [Armatimonadota bacterium]
MSFKKTLIIYITALFLVSILFTASVYAADSPADQYLAMKKKLAARMISPTQMKNDPLTYAGKTIELCGVVNGMITSGDSTSFILNCGDDTIFITTSAPLPTCVTDGSKVRLLASVSDSMTQPQQQLVMAAYEYEITAREKQLAPKVKVPAKTSTRDLSNNVFVTARQNNSVNLSSRAMKIFNPYKAAIAKFNPRLTEAQLNSITGSLLMFSDKYGVDPRFVVALFLAESHFRPEATSRAGAMGLGQLMPGTARGMGVNNAYDTAQNIEASIRLIRGHLGKYKDLELALSAYNAGPGAVKKYGGVPPYKETRNYVRKVSEYYKQLCGIK